MIDAENLLWGCAVGGTLFFFLKVILSMVIGLDHHGEGAVDIAHDAHGTADAFKIFSLYGIGAFLMMFGWVGLALLKEYNLSIGPSVLGGFAAGLVTMILTAKFFALMRKLTSSGATFTIDQAVGLTASVYQQIPAGGRGVVQLTHEGMLRELEAVSEDGKEIASFNDVHIVRAQDSKTVVVKKVS